MRKFFKRAAIIFTIIIILSYIALLFIVPNILNSVNFQTYITKTIAAKTNLNISHNKLSLTVKPNLKSNIKFNRLEIKNDKKELVFKAEDGNLALYPLSFKIQKADIKYIFYDTTKIKSNAQKNKSKKPFDLAKIPDILVHRAEIILQNEKNNHTKIDINDFEIISKNKNKTVNFDAQLKSNYLKHRIYAKNKDKVFVNKNGVVLNDFTIYFENSPLKINGQIDNKNSKQSFTLKGSDISARDIKECFLFYMKQKKKEKNFIENFFDFSGLADINLKFKNKEIKGNVVLKDFRAKTVKFSIPMYFKKGEFVFSGKNIDLEADGFFGGEKLHTTFIARNLFEDEKYTAGTLESSVGQRFASRYIPNLKIKNSADLSLKYFVKDQKPQVEYLIELKKGSDISYNNIRLGLEDKNRRIYAKTLKDKNNMFLKTYDYSTQEKGEIKNIIFGDGLFVKENSKFHLSYISAQTKDYAPVSIIGSIGKYIKDGYFRGKLKYFGQKKLITGTFDLKDTKYKDFIVQNASVNANDKIMEIKAKGTYENEPFSCFINMINSFNDDVVINDIKLYLKKYTIKRAKTSPKKRPIKINDKVKNTNLTIKKGKVVLDKLAFKNIILESLELDGTIEDNMAYFSMPDIDFAKGTLGAVGLYDLDYHSSNIDFSANNIDSNEASSMIFNLQDQFMGLANAKMNVRTYNKLEYIDASAEFSILEGALTKIGNSEFILNSSAKKSIKLYLEKFTNIDIAKIKAIKSNIKGSFDVHNEKIENVELYNQNKSLSLYAQGNYNLSSQNADLCIWGKYAKSSQKGIKILFVPLSWITNFIFRNELSKENYMEQINKIPDIESNSEDTRTFVVGLKGNINSANTIEVNMKKLK